MPSAQRNPPAKEKRLVETFNEKFPVGAEVDYWSTLHDGPVTEGCRVREPAFIGHHGLAVVFLNGMSGSVSVEHVLAPGECPAEANGKRELSPRQRLSELHIEQLGGRLLPKMIEHEATWAIELPDRGAPHTMCQLRLCRLDDGWVAELWNHMSDEEIDCRVGLPNLIRTLGRLKDLVRCLGEDGR